jgi:intraflagellar transport protein 172
LRYVQVAYAWATSLNEDEAAALLRRLSMGESVVDYAVEIGAFNHAFQLAQLAAKHRLEDVHLKYAMFLEDSGRFADAEGEFVAAGELPVSFEHTDGAAHQETVS